MWPVLGKHQLCIQQALCKSWGVTVSQSAASLPVVGGQQVVRWDPRSSCLLVQEQQAPEDTVSSWGLTEEGEPILGPRFQWEKMF